MDTTCRSIRDAFTDYLDGAVNGHEMASISAHLDTCSACANEFAAWRNVQRSLAALGTAHPPAQLQPHLLAALATERANGTHLSPLRRLGRAWDATLAPLALRLSGALAAALILVAGISWLFAAPIAVQANDDRLAHLVAPHYLYSEVPPQPIPTRRDAPIVVEALVDSHGRVYDYQILEGPRDRSVEVRVEDNLLGSVFQPATVFGVPVAGHIVMTYMGVSVHG
jgi:anti-sigma factor RsiW